MVVRKRKKEERQIEEQFAIYQGTSEEAPRHSKTDIREWEEKDKEPEAEEITWEKRIPWGGDTYTQILSNGGEQGGLILKELHPVNGRQFRIEKATRLTIIGQLKEQADLVLPSTAVSRVHASIEQRAGNWYLKDMNSRNGTWVNEQELYGEEEQELINGDQIRFADLIYQWGAACRPFILNGEWYRLFTSMFLHFGIYHLANNMAVLLFMGDMVENAVGHWKYLAIYLGSGLVGNLLSLYMDIQSQSNIVSAGASGAIYGIIGGVFVLMIKNKKQVREIVIRRLVFVIVVTIYYGSQAAQIDNAAHVGGLIGGIVLTVLFTVHKKTTYRNRKEYVAR